MKYFKTEKNELFAFDEEAPIEIVNQKIQELKLIPIAEEEFYQLTTPSLTQLKKEKLAKIKAEFTKSQTKGHFLSSLGFEVDANQISLTNVNSLIDILDDTTTVQFRSYNNNFYNVNKEDLLTIKREIIQYGLQSYQTKWGLEQKIEQAQTKEELEAIQWPEAYSCS